MMIYTLEHTDGCGKTFDKNPTHFKYDPRCRCCEIKDQRIRPDTVEWAQAFVDSVRPGFKVLGIVGEKRKRKMVLLHKECGQTMELDTYTFKKRNGRCKHCKH